MDPFYIINKKKIQPDCTSKRGFSQGKAERRQYLQIKKLFAEVKAFFLWKNKFKNIFFHIIHTLGGKKTCSTMRFLEKYPQKWTY